MEIQTVVTTADRD